jgi:hypothetical protein
MIGREDMIIQEFRFGIVTVSLLSKYKYYEKAGLVFYFASYQQRHVWMAVNLLSFKCNG